MTPPALPSPTDSTSPATVEFRLLGRIDWETLNQLQQRLIYEAGEAHRSTIHVLICEHPASLTVGRQGSRRDIRLTDQQLRQRQIGVQWVNRGGGCVLHGPGQLCVYPIVPLERVGWSVGQFIDRFQRGLESTLSRLCIPHRTCHATGAIRGRSGALVALGVGVRFWVSCYGAYVNVNPPMANYRHVDTATHSSESATMGSLLAERRQSLPMSKVRAALIESLADSFDCPKYNLQTGHRYLLGKALNGNAVARAS